MQYLYFILAVFQLTRAIVTVLVNINTVQDTLWHM